MKPVERERHAGSCPPYILYLGRLSRSKRPDLLAEWFASLKEERETELQLRLCGQGKLGSEIDRRFGHLGAICRLGFVDEDEKRKLIEGCLALVNLSSNESFSLVIMEAWLQRKPVIVNSNCAATHYHVTKSGGGICVANRNQFSQAVVRLQSDWKLREKLGQRGRKYVTDNFSRDAVMTRMLQMFRDM
ncbi:MAG: glycosyltransferase family 4 protein [Roseibium sp.]|uniref:glycosyltransferase family 4 protein n=1 Tax=Roseibium sp. TaxID=1936156 RepID=UPI0026072F38|nr:glycosyltransferase family 4 protein [Roseibium sp.]MCV0429533.1 glycosyltransferase family 4 protein [Roseibium sp.]